MDEGRAMTAWCHLVVCMGLFAGATDPDAAVSSGRKALQPRSGSYPWYDAASDGVRPIDVSEPWYARIDWPRLNLRTSWMQPLAWTLLAILLAVLCYYLVEAYRRRQEAAAGLAGGGTEDGESDARRREALPLPTGSGQGDLLAARQRGDLLAEARRLYQEGRFSEAILYLFSYQLFQLDKQRRIHLAKGKTNRQYLREVGPATPLRHLIEPTMVAFEDVFFGHRAIGRARFESCWLRLPEFEALAREGTP